MKKGGIAVDVSFRFRNEAEFKVSRPAEHERFCNVIGGLFDEIRDLHVARPIGRCPGTIQGASTSRPREIDQRGTLAAPAGNPEAEALRDSSAGEEGFR